MATPLRRLGVITISTPNAMRVALIARQACAYQHANAGPFYKTLSCQRSHRFPGASATLQLLYSTCRVTPLCLRTEQYSTYSTTRVTPFYLRAEQYSICSANRVAPCCLRADHYSTYSTNRDTPLYLRAEQYLDRTALIDCHAMHTYGSILNLAHNLADRISDTLEAKNDDVKGGRIAILCNNDVSYVVAQWATWIVQGLAVPLYPKHPPSEQEYFLRNSESSLIIATEDHEEGIKPIADEIGIRSLILQKRDYLSTVDVSSGEFDVGEERRQRRTNRLNQLHEVNKYKHQAALMVYTSGTTGRPKGVVHTHGSLQSQMSGMVGQWKWTAQDVILHVLPLHHIHGIVNVLMTALYCGATCVMLPHFDPRKVWSTLLSPVTQSLPRSVTLFMTVPTVYAKLIADHDQRLARGRGTRRAKEYVKAVCSTKIRLMVSGSAALPEPVLHQWEEITGHRLLERYGMTETGMVLTNPLAGPRVPGSVGKPFPNTEVCIVRPNVYAKQGYDMLAYSSHRRTTVTPGCNDESGELYVRGTSLFSQYWQQPEETASSFTADGWFKTGDTACFKDGTYRILGRTSVDIIKSGGYKISALDVERHLLAHASIAAVAVLGLPDITWGQRVAAVVVLAPTTDHKSDRETDQLSLPELREWAADHMPSYQIPTVLKVVAAIPCNAMGKVNKKELLSQVFAKELKRSM